MKPLTYNYDAETDTLTVEGIRYGGAMFRDLGVNGLTPGRVFQVVNREKDGAIVLKTIKRAVIAAALEG